MRALSPASTPDKLLFRMDDRVYRFIVQQGEPGVSAIGFEVKTRAALDELGEQVEASGIAVKEDPSLAKEAEVLDQRWRRSIADIVRHGRQTGEFADGEDPEEIGRKLGALIDGLAIQVLMNQTQVSPEHMRRMCLEVAASLIGFELEPATSS